MDYGELRATLSSLSLHDSNIQELKKDLQGVEQRLARPEKHMAPGMDIVMGISLQLKRRVETLKQIVLGQQQPSQPYFGQPPVTVISGMPGFSIGLPIMISNAQNVKNEVVVEDFTHTAEASIRPVK